MQAVAAARAGVVLDVDDHLHARQVGRQGSAVRPASGARSRPICRIGLLGLFLAGRLDLLGFLEPEQQLIFGQALGPSAEAVPLQFLDDLSQPGVLDIARQHHRLQRVRIVGKLVSRDCHLGDDSTFAACRRQRNGG